MPPTSEPTNVIDQTAQLGGAQPGATHRAGTQSGAKPRESSGASRAHPLSLEIPIGVQGSRRLTSAPGQPEKLEQFSEDTRTVIVFPQGAVIRLGAAVAQGQMLVIANRQSQQEVLCTVLNVKNHANVKGYVEIEFNQPMNGFWGVYFPEESKGPGSPIQAPLPGPPPVSSAAPAQRQTAPVVEMPSGNGKPSVESGLPASAPPAGKANAPTGTLTSDFWGSSFPEEILTPAAAVSSEKHPTTVPPAQNNSAPVPANGSPAVPAAPPVRPANVPTPEEIWSASALKEGAKAPNAPKMQAPVPAPSAPINVPQARQQQSTPFVVQSRTGTPMEVKTEPLAEAASTLMPPAARHEDDWRAGNAQQSPLSSMSDLLGTKVDAPYASTTHHTAHPPNRMGMIVGVGVIVVAAIGAGIYFKGSSSKAPATAAATAPVSAPGSSSSATSAPANEPPTAPAATDTASATKTPPPPPAASSSSKPEPPPARPTRTQQVASAQPAPAEEPQPRPAWNGKLPSGKIAAAPAVRVTGSAAPPDLNAGNNSISGVQGFLGANANAAPAPPPVAPATRVSDLKEPRLLTSVTPVYPPAARVAQVEGVVVINAVIDEGGRVTNAKAVSGPSVLRGAAVEAVSKWRYQPGVINGKPSKMELNITVQFHLR